LRSCCAVEKTVCGSLSALGSSAAWMRCRGTSTIFPTSSRCVRFDRRSSRYRFASARTPRMHHAEFLCDSDALFCIFASSRKTIAIYLAIKRQALSIVHRAGRRRNPKHALEIVV
jgi:hypothetical protein